MMLKKHIAASLDDVNARTQKNYDAIWQAHAGGFGPPNPEIISFFYQYSPKPLDRCSVIDVASGNGRYAIEFAKLGFGHVVALEISKAGCDLIRERAHNNPKITISQEDILNMDIQKSTHKYDIVFSSGLLEEFESAADQTAAVSVMQKMTRPSGLLVLRYCLFISNREPENRVQPNLVKPMFKENKWDILHYSTDDSPRFNKKSTIPDRENIIQRQTIVAIKPG